MGNATSAPRRLG
jgi:hypothetical protein